MKRKLFTLTFTLRNLSPEDDAAEVLEQERAKIKQQLEGLSNIDKENVEKRVRKELKMDDERTVSLFHV